MAGEEGEGEGFTGGKRMQTSIEDKNAPTPAKKFRPNNDDDEICSYLNKFPKTPAGTVKTWEECARTVDTALDELRQLYDAFMWNDEDDDKAKKAAAEKAEKLVSELKRDSRIKNIDMDLDWSKVDDLLSHEACPDLEKLGKDES